MVSIVLLFVLCPFILVNAETTNNGTASENQITVENFVGAFAQIFGPEGRGSQFFSLMIGLGAYSIFVYYFYRFLAKRELFPKFHKRVEIANKKSLAELAISVIFYVVCFPIVVLIWSIVYWFFILVMNLNSDPNIAFLTSMALIGVIRLTAYFREDLSQEVGKTLPFAMMAIFLTEIVVTGQPNSFHYEKLLSSTTLLSDNIMKILVGIFILSILEGVLRGAFIIKRKIFPIKGD